MDGQYVTAASKVTIVGWLLCEAMNWSTLGGSYRWFFAMIVVLFVCLKSLMSC